MTSGDDRQEWGFLLSALGSPTVSVVQRLEARCPYPPGGDCRGRSNDSYNWEHLASSLQTINQTTKQISFPKKRANSVEVGSASPTLPPFRALQGPCEAGMPSVITRVSQGTERSREKANEMEFLNLSLYSWQSFPSHLPAGVTIMSCYMFMIWYLLH